MLGWEIPWMPGDALLNMWILKCTLGTISTGWIKFQTALIIITGNDSDIHTSFSRCYTAHLLTPLSSNDCGRTVYCNESTLINSVYLLWFKVMLQQNTDVFLEKQLNMSNWKL
jgi:hypothetical protein